MPPTLIASIYGMNFHIMPELNDKWGIIIIMIVCAIAPFLYFRKKRLASTNGVEVLYQRVFPRNRAYTFFSARAYPQNTERHNGKWC